MGHKNRIKFQSRFLPAGLRFGVSPLITFAAIISIVADRTWQSCEATSQHAPTAV